MEFSFIIALIVTSIKNKLYKTLGYWFRDVLNFFFLEKGLGILSPQHLEYDFSRKISLMSYSINCPNFFVWLPLLLEILDIMCIAIVCFPGCDVINFKLTLSFLWSRFSTCPKIQDKNWNILTTDRAFKVK